MRIFTFKKIMKALSLVAVLLAAFFIFVGIYTRKNAGGLNYAVIFAGAMILIFTAVIWILSYVKEKKERNGNS